MIDDLEEFRSRLDSATSLYMKRSFEEIDSLFQMEDEESFESIQLECDRIDRAFLDDHDHQNIDLDPTTTVLALMRGNITFVKRHTLDGARAEPPLEEIKRVERIIHTTLRFALEDSVDLLLKLYQEDPYLKHVVQTEAHVEEMPLEGGPAQQALDNDGGLLFAQVQREYLVSVAILAAVLLIGAGAFVVVSICEIKRLLEWHRNCEQSAAAAALKAHNCTRNRKRKTPRISSNHVSIDDNNNGGLMNKDCMDIEIAESCRRGVCSSDSVSEDE